MSLTREQTLHEMGLTQWKLRARPAAQGDVLEEVHEEVHEEAHEETREKAPGDAQGEFRDAQRDESQEEFQAAARAAASAAGALENDFAPERVPDDVPDFVPDYASAAMTADQGAPAGERSAQIARMNWDELRSSIADCRACGLCAERQQAVLGVGDEQADWLFIGEAPGAEEDARDEPFVGPAGKLLDAMLAAIDLERGADVYIANTVKCRPPANHTLETNEMAACTPYLQRQIELLQPKLIVLLGRAAVQALLGVEGSLASLRGKTLTHAVGGREIPVIVTYHPAYLLRTLPDKAKTWEDLCRARALMRELKAGSGLVAPLGTPN